MSEPANNPVPYCATTLNYAAGMDPAPVPVTIHHARTSPGLAYDPCGFTLLRHQSAVGNWQDENHIATVHSAEVARLAQDLLGCQRTLVYPPLVRSPAAAASEADYAPIEFVHSDFTHDYRPMAQGPDRPYRAFVEPLLAEQGLTQADLQRAERMVLLQFWRNTGARRPDRPLAFCDARSVPRSDLDILVVPEYGGKRLEFETFFATAPDNPDRHRWYTYPDLGLDEVVAFRTYDSQLADQGQAFWTLHSAFVDPVAGPTAPRRESLEMRVLCLWGI